MIFFSSSLFFPCNLSIKSFAYKLIVDIVLRARQNYMMNGRVRNREKELLVYLPEAKNVELERRIMTNSVVYFSASNYWVSSCPPRIVAGPQSTNASTSCEYYSTLVFWYMPGLIIYVLCTIWDMKLLDAFWLFKQLYEF